MAEDQWFVILDGVKKGPYSLRMLRGLDGITPDTLAWKKGMAEWKPMRGIPELQLLFEDSEELTPPTKEAEKGTGANGLALTLPNVEPPRLFWIMFAIIICLYALFLFYFY